MSEHKRGSGKRVLARRNRRRTDREPNRGWWWVGAIALVIAMLDWSTKLLVATRIPLGDLVVIVEGRIALWHVRNPALILGLFGDLPLSSRKLIVTVLGVVATALLISVVVRSHRLLPSRRPWAWLFAGLLGGGILGNLGERVLHWWVTDFLSFGWGHVWLPPGNVADLSIVLAIPLAFVVIAFELEARSLRRSPVAPRRSGVLVGPGLGPTVE